ncbi:MAG TPA: FlgO family outer membrane protein [Candidatus Krumholzibacteria bacterium]
MSGSRTVRVDGRHCMAARKRMGLTREALERKAGISVATIKRAEQGREIFLETARTLAATLGQPIDDLLHGSEKAHGTSATRASDDRPPASVAVLPFKTIGPGPDAMHLADGLVEDLIHRLGRSLFPVVSPASTLAHPGRSLSHQGLAQELRADYLVVGATQRAADQIRVTARIVRASDYCVLASEQYERDYSDVFAAQNELAARIVEQVGSMLLKVESSSLLQRDPSDLSAWELAVRGSWHFHAGTQEGNAEARGLFERAVSKDPGLALAWYSLAMTHQREIVNQWSPDPAQCLVGMKQVYEEFSRWHPREPWLAIVAAYISVYSGQREAAMSRLAEAIHLNPNAAAAYSLYGQTLAMANEPDRAIDQFDTALRIGPLDPERWSLYTAIALAHFVAERYQETVAWAERATNLRPDVPFPHGTLASALGHLGRLPEARRALEVMVKLAPTASMKGMETLIASTNRDIAQRYQAGLRVAGLAS